MYLHFSMQEQDILTILMESVICVHFGQLIDNYVAWACTSK